jgi:hypothetical protein
VTYDHTGRNPLRSEEDKEHTWAPGSFGAVFYDSYCKKKKKKKKKNSNRVDSNMCLGSGKMG